MGGQEYDRVLMAPRPDEPEEPGAGGSRQVLIEHHHTDEAGRQLTQSPLRCVHREHDMALGGKELGDQPPHPGIVVDDKNVR